MKLIVLIYIFISVLELCKSNEYAFHYRTSFASAPHRNIPTFEDRLRRNVPLVECFEPRGLRVSIADMPEIEQVNIHRQYCNNCYSSHYEQIKAKQNGRWVMAIPDAVINIGEVLKFTLTCTTKNTNYVVDTTTLVSDLIPAPSDLSFPKAVPIEIPQQSYPQNSDKTAPHNQFASQPPDGYCPCPPTNHIRPSTFNPIVNSFNFNNNHTQFPEQSELSTTTDQTNIIGKDISTQITTTSPTTVNVAENIQPAITTIRPATSTMSNSQSTSSTTTPVPSSPSTKTTPKISTKPLKIAHENLQQTKKEIELLRALLEKTKKALSENNKATT